MTHLENYLNLAKYLFPETFDFNLRFKPTKLPNTYIAYRSIASLHNTTGL